MRRPGSQSWPQALPRLVLATYSMAKYVALTTLAAVTLIGSSVGRGAGAGILERTWSSIARSTCS